MHFHARQNRQFEANILTIGCIAGALRMVIAIYRDLPLETVNLDLVVDCALLVVFGMPLILLRFQIRFEYITVPFSFLVMAFLFANWIVLNGLNGTGEYYFLGGMVLMALIHKGRWLIFFVTLSVLLEIGLLYIWIFRSDWMNYGSVNFQNTRHYLWIMIVVTTALLYHKTQFDIKRENLRKKRKNLESKIETLDRQNIQLEEQKKMLQLSNEWLEENIKQRSDKLLHQRKSIEQYLSVTLFEIGPYLESTVESIDKLDHKTKETTMGSLLIQSVDHLQLAIKSVTDKLKKGVYYNPEN
ncbi:hypothetical protein N7E81_16695 [Reichenbachiella carrageenanivorans]|uniref:Histidine kinase n=1 Tax=Reichenbachiella carrageenanivorans TaxID=2979869 RepID=A0ABY6CZX7_9BACT|nr:hypothetical protein [Reichenbachiella carrageenanivorans]UXX78994.1 hypothetical protein N7E81_16695 [Reichenbachiella carrageenanivorans]